MAAMASVQDILKDRSGTSRAMPSLLCYEMSLKLRRYGFHVSRYGACVLRYILRIFRNGWMDCRDAFHAVLCLYFCVMDKT